MPNIITGALTATQPISTNTTTIIDQNATIVVVAPSSLTAGLAVGIYNGAEER